MQQSSNLIKEFGSRHFRYDVDLDGPVLPGLFVKHTFGGFFSKIATSFWRHFSHFGPKLVTLKSHISNSAKAMAPKVNQIIFFEKLCRN